MMVNFKDFYMFSFSNDVDMKLVSIIHRTMWDNLIYINEISYIDAQNSLLKYIAH